MTEDLTCQAGDSEATRDQNSGKPLELTARGTKVGNGAPGAQGLGHLRRLVELSGCVCRKEVQAPPEVGGRN